MTPVSGTQLSMVFGADGMVNGNTGCNMFNATYALSGSTISFGPIATTRRACLSDDASQQEHLFLAALSATTAYELAGDRLTFRDSSGATQINESDRPSSHRPEREPCNIGSGVQAPLTLFRSGEMRCCVAHVLV